MDAARLRSYLLTLPHAVETMQWGDNLVFWAGDKAIGGKMFALLNLEAASDETGHRRRVIGQGVMMYAAGRERYGELLEIDGILPAPYLARAHWVAAEHWQVFRAEDWKSELRAAHALILAKLPLKTRKILALPLAEQRKLIAERRAAQTGRSAD